MAVVTGEKNDVSHMHEASNKNVVHDAENSWEDKKAILRDCHSLDCTFFVKRVPSSDKFISSSVVSYLPRQIMYNANCLPDT